VDAYRGLLEEDPTEWAALDALTRITISRFYRERDVFDYLCEVALPGLHARAAPKPVRVWSAGCAAGEEAYTLAIAAQQQSIPLQIVATDCDEHQLVRAREARYSAGCLKDLPAPWRVSAFDHEGDEFVLRDELRADVELRKQDIRQDMPTGPFDLILCRYVAFTYFEAHLQRRIAERLLTRVVRDGFIVLGKHESWPQDIVGLDETKPGLRVYRKL
jgi:chemotaxis protein methyltransferase CheR